MDKLIQDSLSQFGLSAKESKFFLICFKIGPATINEIARKARIRRSTAYLIAETLLQKQLIEEDLHHYKKKIVTVEPKTLLRMLSAKQRAIGRQELELKEKLADLQAVYNASDVRPKVRVFEGINGLSAVEKDILSAKKEILLWTNQETENNFFSKQFHNQFIEIRKRKGIFIRVLAVNNKKGRLLQSTDKGSLRETRLLPKNRSFSPETYIYDDKIAMLDYKKDIIGVIIQSEPLSSAQKAVFELSWSMV